MKSWFVQQDLHFTFCSECEEKVLNKINELDPKAFVF